jgi:hypothetical protein
MNDTQLELSFGQRSMGSHLTPRQRRLSRANWWFERMRQVADHAFEWRPAPLPPPEQIWFTGAQRQIEVASPATPSNAVPQQQEICE